MKKIDIENEDSINTYGYDIIKHIKCLIELLDDEYSAKGKVSEELYKKLKIRRYDLIFLIRSAEKEVLGEEIDLSNLIKSKEELTLLKEKNNNVAVLKARINYLYHILSKVTSKVAFYASHIDYSKKLKRSK